ncbi:thiol oxidoreductase [Wenyingzhuangia fucanilytica]|uniref:Thiol oxidoreductase n=1 Tax=Wenyingzhuangia fucanilytica TaxID=1790137 RepID=A0A1B1Y6G7_9FLAO|nr:di-heme oxidoredictase family protein [Wenyingzhuangia fucanilytica]ANW96337.1 thiol oxidoreductase [Wenyingzhuangia fucanilytica]
MFKSFKIYLSTICILSALNSCQTDDPVNEYEIFVNENYVPGEENLIGKFSVEAYSADLAFGSKIPGLTNLEPKIFVIGNAIFKQNWVQSPASTTTRDGLGPLFNARSCSSCHSKDGRGKPMLTNNEASQGFLIRLSKDNDFVHGPIGMDNYGGQFQDLAITNANSEGNINVSFEIVSGAYPDGETYELRKPIYTLTDINGLPIVTPYTSPRVGTQTIGLGFIDALSDDSILANADEDDIDNDGISGKANYVWDVVNNKTSLGKFGWKANQPNLKQQIAGALSGDMGLTTSIFPQENCPNNDCSNYPNGVNIDDTVEVPDNQFNDLLLYQVALSVPVRRDVKDVDVLKGKKLFNSLACVKCHVDEFTTSSNYDYLPLIENTTIKPYSDFLLHDMGSDLADNRADFLAEGNEWRTQPLWGLGMIETVNNHTFLLHDGRARNIEEAILWHGGEAETAKNNFKKLSKTERLQLLKFLNSL